MIFWHTCLVNEFAPEVGFAVVAVLERLGEQVEVPREQTCCGQPAFNAGFHDAAREAAKHTIAVLEKTSGPIIIPSGSCGDMMSHQYIGLLHDDDEWRVRAEAVAARCVEFSAWVAKHLDGLPLSAIESSATYHPSCHLLRGLGIDAEPRAVLAAIPALDTRPLVADDECCGFGGLFSVKHADISTRMLERKLDHVAASGAERVVSCDLGCLMHIDGGLRRRGAKVRAQHLAELLAEALR